MIIEYYKPRRKNEANLITTDTSRLCFIIMQKVNKNKLETKEWINDKSGPRFFSFLKKEKTTRTTRTTFYFKKSHKSWKKFAELVLTPIINTMKEILTEYIEFKQHGTDIDINLMKFRQKCAELKRDINVGKFTKPILKHIAPNFHFDKLKFLDDEIDSSSEKTIEEKPKKNIKIKVKKV